MHQQVVVASATRQLDDPVAPGALVGQGQIGEPEAVRVLGKQELRCHTLDARGAGRQHGVQ